MDWKNHEKLRFVLIALFFIVGMTLTQVGWSMTGQLLGVGVMCVGMVFLLAALFVYNARYK